MFGVKTKYIKTGDNKIIVFSGALQHDEFRKFNPVSAGFISFGALGKYDPDCTCYGESVSLKLKSDEDEDTRLAKQQLLGLIY